MFWIIFNFSLSAFNLYNACVGTEKWVIILCAFASGVALISGLLATATYRAEHKQW